MNDFNISFPIDQLAKAIVEKLQNFYIPITKKIDPVSEEYITREQVSELLQISLPTVDSWTKKGILFAYRIETTKRYKKSEVEAALIKVNFGKIK
jgi:excisionase family DNA binding protein